MKLHELLAIEGNLESQAAKVTSDLAATFASKRHLFEEKLVTFQSSEDGVAPVTEAQSDIQSTVKKELKWLGQHLSKSLDASFQVATANTQAKADIELEDGTILAKDVPATSLLELEKRVTAIHNLVLGIPTLDPAKGFRPDDTKGENIYAAREVLKTRTKKTAKVLVKYQATKEHPAQTEIVHEDVPVGKIREQEWSSLITPADKAELINRVEVLQRAVRSARARANEQEVDKTKKIGAALIDYVFGK